MSGYQIFKLFLNPRCNVIHCSNLYSSRYVEVEHILELSVIDQHISRSIGLGIGMRYYCGHYCIYIWFDHILLSEKDFSARMIVLNTSANRVLCVSLGYMRRAHLLNSYFVSFRYSENSAT
jgi:hypothetical protein